MSHMPWTDRCCILKFHYFQPILYKLNCLFVCLFKCFMDKLRSVLNLQHRSPASQSGTLPILPCGFQCSIKLTVHKYEHFISQKDCIRRLGLKDRDYPLQFSFLVLKYSAPHILIISVESNELTYIGLISVPRNTITYATPP